MRWHMKTGRKKAVVPAVMEMAEEMEIPEETVAAGTGHKKPAVASSEKRAGSTKKAGECYDCDHNSDFADRAYRCCFDLSNRAE